MERVIGVSWLVGSLRAEGCAFMLARYRSEPTREHGAALDHHLRGLREFTGRMLDEAIEARRLERGTDATA